MGPGDVASARREEKKSFQIECDQQKLEMLMLTSCNQHHEIKLDDDSYVITFLHKMCCYKNCQTTISLIQTTFNRNRSVNQSNQKKLKSSCLQGLMNRKQLYYTQKYLSYKHRQ